MAWSSYAHLLNNEDEYIKVLSSFKDGISIKSVDEIIADCKKKEKVQHHYRSNLAKIGFFKINNNNTIKLNYDPCELKNNKNYLRTIFRNLLKANKEKEVQILSEIIFYLQSYELKPIIDELSIRYPLIDQKSLTRWLRPLIYLMKLADILSMKKVDRGFMDASHLQESYLKIANSFSKAISLELIEDELKKIDSSLDLIKVIDNILNNYNAKFKIELLMMPNWATKNKCYKINEDIYTHIKIKSNLLKGELK